LGGQSSTATAQTGPPPAATGAATTPAERSRPPLPPADSGLTVDDGFIADNAPLSPFDTSLPAIANLDAGLRDAILSAATDAHASGIEMVINSGWRSERYQQALLDEAVVTYGSEEEARKWVNTPDASKHVTGEAVDIGPTDADDWLLQHGSDYGLCQAYANEMWHFELLVEPGGVCPAPIVDASGG
jgi:sugar/nucleoside kinase (ribokinase family)